jgi:hypothetical protein
MKRWAAGAELIAESNWESDVISVRVAMVVKFSGKRLGYVAKVVGMWALRKIKETCETSS